MLLLLFVFFLRIDVISLKCQNQTMIFQGPDDVYTFLEDDLMDFVDLFIYCDY